MDNSVTGRFYRVEMLEDGRTQFEDLLDQVFERELIERECDLDPRPTNSIIARLERLLLDGEFLSGEFIRRQTENKPPEANAEGLNPLQLADDGGLGHACAFSYHLPTETMCIQHNPSSLSANRVGTYCETMDRGARFLFQRIPTQNALERFRNGTPRSLQVSFASPVNLPAIEGPDGAADMTVVNAARMLGEAFNGMNVSIEVSMGRNEGHLDKNKIETLRDTMLQWWRGGDADLRKLRVKSKTADGSETEMIDFLEEFLKEHTSLDLPDDNPDRNYELRAIQIRTWHRNHLPYLTELFG